MTDDTVETETAPGRRLTRLSAGVLDQFLSSGSNFLGLIVAARMLTKDGFGAYAVAITTFTVLLGLCRALNGEALLVRVGDESVTHRDRVSRAATDGLSIGLVVVPLLLIVAALVDGPTAGALLALAFTLPLLLLQDTLRYSAFARAMPQLAVRSDAIWVGLQVVAYVAVYAVGEPSAFIMVLAWAGTGALAGLLHLWLDNVGLVFGRPFSWVRENVDLGGRYALDFVAGTGVAQLASYALVGVAGVAALGALRGAQTAFGPVNVLSGGSYSVVVPEAKRLARTSVRKVTILCASVASVLSVVSMATYLLLWMLSEDQGRLILGDSWIDARQVLLPVALASTAGSVFSGASAGLRALEAARELLRTRLFTTPVALVVPTFCAWRWGLQGAAWGIAATVWWNNIWWWRSYALAARRTQSSLRAEPAGPAPVT